MHVGAHGSALDGKTPRGGDSLGQWRHHQLCSRGLSAGAAVPARRWWEEVPREELSALRHPPA